MNLVKVVRGNETYSNLLLLSLISLLVLHSSVSLFNTVGQCSELFNSVRFYFPLTVSFKDFFQLIASLNK